MRSGILIKLALVALFCMTFCGCGGGGGGPATTPIALTTTSPVLVNYSTTVFANYSGTTVSDATSVTFAIVGFKSYSSNGAGTASLSAQTKVTSSSGGKHRASVRVKSNVNSDVTVSSSSGNYAGSTVINFIPQPDKAVVHIGLKKNVRNLAHLALGVRSENLPNAFTFSSIAPFKNFSTYGKVGNGTLLAAGSDIYAWDILILGANITSGDTLLDLTLQEAAPGIPVFSVYRNNPSALLYKNYSGNSINTLGADVPLATTDFTLSTEYYRGTTLLSPRP